MAEDDPLFCEVIAEVLANADLDVVGASSGDEALSLLDDPDGIDALVAELNMPDVDGLQVAWPAREHRPDVSALFISGRVDLLQASPAPAPFRRVGKPPRMADPTEAVTTPSDGDQGRGLLRPPGRSVRGGAAASHVGSLAPDSPSLARNLVALRGHMASRF